MKTDQPLKEGIPYEVKDGLVYEVWLLNHQKLVRIVCKSPKEALYLIDNWIPQVRE